MEWIWIVLIVVLLFGAKKIPDIAKGLGQGIKEFKATSKEDTDTTVVTPRRDSDV